MIIDGRKLAGEIAGKLKNKNKLPRLTIGAVLVGGNAASLSFLKQKSKTAEKSGIGFKVFEFDSRIAAARLKREILKLNQDKNINGIIVQLPLPKHVNPDEILAAIDPKKDVDALSKRPLVLAPTLGAVKFIFKKYRIGYKDKEILIIGRGRLVGQPIYEWLVKENKRVKVIDERQKNRFPKFTRNADIIISGVGKGGLIKGEMIKRGTILIDFGFDRKDGKITGDFDFKSCAKKAKLITPVPSGMGPIMVAMLFKNLVKLNKKS